MRFKQLRALVAECANDELAKTRLFPMRSIYAGEYFLQAEISKGCVTWSIREITHYENATVGPSPDIDVPLQICNLHIQAVALCRGPTD